MPLKTLFIINSLAGGGAERVFTTIVSASKDRAASGSIEVALLDDEPDAYTLPDWVVVHRLRGQGGLVESIRSLHKLVQQIRPDVAVSFLTRANVAAAIVMTLAGRPLVLSERVNTTAHLGAGRAAALSKLLVRLTYGRAKRIIAVSQGVIDTLATDFGISRGLMDAVANPVDTPAIVAKAAVASPYDHLRPYIAGMGRLVPNKNFPMTIRAFAASGIGGNLLILGEGPDRQVLEDLARELGVVERVHFAGFEANPYAAIARAEFVVLSSNAEGFPNAMVEALACGVPVAATDCLSGPSEVLDVKSAPGEAREGLGGLLVPVNDVEAMTSALRALQDQGLRERLSKKGVERAMSYSVARAVDKYWSIIGQAVDASK